MEPIGNFCLVFLLIVRGLNNPNITKLVVIHSQPCEVSITCASYMGVVKNLISTTMDVLQEICSWVSVKIINKIFIMSLFISKYVFLISFKNKVRQMLVKYLLSTGILHRLDKGNQWIHFERKDPYYIYSGIMRTFKNILV